MKKKLIIVFCSLMLSSSLVFSGCSNKESVASNSNDKEKEIALSNEKGSIVNLNLYFDSSNDNNLTQISKEERSMKSDELMGELIIQELIKGPSLKSGYKQILPKETRLLSFSIKDKIAYVNLSKEANIVLLPAREKAVVQSIVMSLTNVSSIVKVKISIDNTDTNLWGGGMNLTKPLGRDDFLNGTK